MFVNKDPLGNPVDRNHPWNQHTIPRPQKRNFDDKYCWVMSPRWFDGTDHLARTPAADRCPGSGDRAGRPGGQRLRQGHRAQRADQPAPNDQQARGELRVEDPEGEAGQAAVQRDRA